MNFIFCLLFVPLLIHNQDGYIALIEQLRVERAMQGLVSKENDKDKDKKDLEEERTKALIEKEKSKYLSRRVQ